MQERTSRLVEVAISQRMADLSLDQRALATRSGVTAATVRDLQRGLVRRYQPATLAKVSLALGWPRDRIIRLLSSVEGKGGRSTGRAADGDLSRLESLEAELDALRRRLAGETVGG